MANHLSLLNMFRDSLLFHASFEPLNCGESYSFRRYTGPNSWINDERRATARDIEVVYAAAKAGDLERFRRHAS